LSAKLTAGRSIDSDSTWREILIHASDAASKASPLIGVIKPSTRQSKSYGELAALLPPDVRLSARHAPVEHGALEEFARAIPTYETLAAELVEEGADIIHAEGTPPFMILGYAGERETIDRWEQRFQRPVFTSTMCQTNALRALGVEKLVDAGYDPTTGPHAERYFRDAGFQVLGVEKVPVDWGVVGDVSDDDAYEMLAGVLRKFGGADGLCLQGSSKWRLSGVIPRLEREFGVSVVHPVAARYWELMARLGRRIAKPDLGRLLSEMPKYSSSV
jgi:maleate isomerase